jgi:hypothetical protein
VIKSNAAADRYRPGSDCRMKYCHYVLDSFLRTSGPFFFNYCWDQRGTAAVASWTMLFSETLASFNLCISRISLQGTNSSTSAPLFLS